MLTTHPGDRKTAVVVDVDNIVSIQKVPKLTYFTLLKKCLPDKRICFWQELSEEDPEDLDWEDIHLRNFKCSIKGGVNPATISKPEICIFFTILIMNMYPIITNINNSS